MTSLPGLNIQYPISRLILSGEKTVETRIYPLPDIYIGREMAIIETPGKTGKFKARIVGIVVFSRCFKYKSKRQFYDDIEKHRVTPDSPWRWEPSKPKWGWEIDKVHLLKEPKTAPLKRGIVYTKDIRL